MLVHSTARSPLVTRTPAVGARPTTREQGIVAIHAFMVQEQARYAAAGVWQLEGNRSFFAPTAQTPPKGIVVFFHGFTGGTVQARHLIQPLLDAGYDVFLPAFPGHGLQRKDGSLDTSEVPSRKESWRWDGFTRRICDLVSAWDNVRPVGLSTGGAAALKLAEMDSVLGRNKVKRVIAMAPFLKPAGSGLKNLGRLLFSSAINGSAVAVAAGGSAYGNGPARHRPGFPAVPPYGMLRLPFDNILGSADFGRRVYQNRHLVRVPVDTVLTEVDKFAALAPARTISDETGGRSLVFPASAQVPHALVSPFENQSPGASDQVAQFILSSLRT